MKCSWYLCLTTSFALLGSASAWTSSDAKHEPHSPGTGEEAGIHVHGLHFECPLPTSAVDVLRCAQDNHPEVRRAKLVAETSKTLIEAASQIPNPELETQSVFGEALGDQIMQTQISLTQPLEWGGNRSARKETARAQEQQAEADLRSVQAKVIVQTVVNLHRLRQIENEKAILDEAIGSYTKLVGQYRSRPKLAPEQEVSLSVFEMALADSRLKRSVLVEEEREIGHFFHLSTGNGLPEIRRALPKPVASWPEVTKRDVALGPSPAAFRLLADQSLALAELDTARAQSWPGLRLGPMVQLESAGGLQSQLYGFQLNIDLPVFNLNGGGRAYANRNVVRVEKTIELLRVEESHERGEQLRNYEGAVHALLEMSSARDLERKHDRAEQLSMRGLISSSLIIEAHRQRAELEHSRNEREIKAISSLWTIYSLDGKIFEVTP